MSRVDDALHTLESFAGSAIRFGAHPSDNALITLLVHMALSDGVLDDAELRMLQRVSPHAEEAKTRQWIQEILNAPLDLARIADQLDTDDRRWTSLRFAARMAWRDEQLAAEERTFLTQLASGLELPPTALDRVLREMSGPPAAAIEVSHLREVLKSMAWDAADFADGHVQSSDLVPHIPAGAKPVARIGVDQAEVLGIYDRGIVGRFLEGAAFLSWQRIVGCTRGAGLESSVRIHTEDGRIWSIIDARLGAIGLLYDRLFREGDPDPTESEPYITRAPYTLDDR